MNLTEKQAVMLIEHENTLVRGLGFVFLRYILKPTKIWEWFEPYLDDPAVFAPGDSNVEVAMGDFVMDLLNKQKYFSTNLPRIPKAIHTIFQRELLKRELLKERDAGSEWMRDELEIGTEVQALYEADGQWYNAKIEKFVDGGRFIVLFVDYDEEAEVSIGCIKYEGAASRKRKRSGSPEGGDRRRKRRRDDRDRRRDDRDRRGDRRRRSADRRGRRKRDEIPARMKQLPDAFTTEALDAIIKQRESRKYVSSNSYDVIRHQESSSRGSMPFESATRRQRTPPPAERSAPKVKRPVMPKAPPKKELTAEQKIQNQMRMAELMKRYGNASANA